MSDDDLIARFGSARRPERPPGHPVPDGVDDETVAALGELSAAFEVIEEARGYLYAFHRRSGTADLALQHAVDHLRQAGHHALADEIDQVLVGRDVLRACGPTRSSRPTTAPTTTSGGSRWRRPSASPAPAHPTSPSPT